MANDRWRLQMEAARYAMHKHAVQRYAEAIVRDGMSEDEAHYHYDRLMQNYDGIVAEAVSGRSREAMAEEMTKGASAIAESVELMRAKANV